MKACIFHDMSPGQQDRKIFEVVEHAFNSRTSVLIYASSQERADAIDRFLWILKQESFMPHKQFPENEPDPSITIGIVTSEINPVDAGILIADGHCSLEFAEKFDTVHEFVNRSSPEIHEACRERFRSYRANKVPVEHLKE
ncbi:MAG: DNA polymerase III subunit chi [Acidobacteria bacterium]|nr:DNA polymerase III subunit chi [Acidobacteriota bacterium]